MGVRERTPPPGAVAVCAHEPVGGPLVQRRVRGDSVGEFGVDQEFREPAGGRVRVAGQAARTSGSGSRVSPSTTSGPVRGSRAVTGEAGLTYPTVYGRRPGMRMPAPTAHRPDTPAPGLSNAPAAETSCPAH
ncbi:hypothetical protein GCM10017687_24960 [Streptomyces echinatus]